MASKRKDKKETFTKIILGGNGDGEIFVRTRDLNKQKRLLKTQAPTKKVVENVFKMLLHSPDGFSKLSKSISAISYIYGERSISTLNNIKDIIEGRIWQLKQKPKEKVKRKK